ncbi:cobyrinate a,c-diamide synthase [Candidatus Cetobacterium colombiensis]|jgi:cobyrinic acid a,c-diamide synthase|uniref:Cobyrinate a,c-diamide synthase n=1 Tax=Candidatus Cetobacterium colombiensis TaxID=3073100 RepID=A0ABU4W6J1_9FUSO|nr:cobyrinate a,c-diamide synthase [Candidatus Cetobacterium colombiensis]MDX8335142.1 cobyrinate a,c-diamide synthase [Candidatus Cetobacterium colombiensis]
MKGFVLAGTRSGIGKTTVSMGLMAAFENVSPFKVGPDYIDPSFHKFMTGNKSYNLDLFLMGEEGVKYSFSKHQKDISIVEGVMGLYDGLGNSLDNYSTAHLARVLDLPVVLVVDAIGKSTSIAAEVLGYKNLDPRVKIAGVIINRVSSEKLYEMLKEAIEEYTKVPCLGYLRKNEELGISSRHLGLLQADEVQNLEEKKEMLKQEIKKTIDLEKIKQIANLNRTFEGEDIFKNLENLYNGLKVGVAKDKAFSFYYEDNLELLNKMGVELLEFSPIDDKCIPDVDVLYFGGGYPENYLEELSKNNEFKNSLKSFHEKGGVIYGECGGFMYLTKGIKTLDEKFYSMADLVDCSIKMTGKLLISRFGYVDLSYEKLTGRAHEFHYSTIDEVGNDKREFKLLKKDGREWLCGYKNKNLLAGYPHLHFFKNIDILKKILEGVKKCHI